MSTLALGEPELPMAAADFEALERRVIRTVELLKSERELRAAARGEVGLYVDNGSDGVFANAHIVPGS